MPTTPQMPPDDESPDELQRRLNAAKRQEISDQYGAEFFDEDAEDLPPEVESQWLDHVAELEAQFENAKQVTVREFVGFPPVRALAEVPPAALEATLEELLNTLAEAEVFVDFIYEVAPTEAYRFIVEELLDEEMDDVRIEGLQHHFIYEEFHPNHPADVQTWAEEFMTSLVKHDIERLKMATAAEFKAAGRTYANTQLPELAARFHRQHPELTNFTSKLISCKVSDDLSTAAAEYVVTWESNPVGTPLDNMQTVGRATFTHHHDEEGYWEVHQVNFPGFG